MVEERVSVGGALLWTVTSGNGPPLVLAHGGPGMWDHLEPVARMVDDLVTVHRYDQRGCGRSPAGPPYRIGDLMRDLDGLRRHWGHDRWIVGGHSWGSQLALFYAARNPARVAGLLLLDTAGLAAPDLSARRRERLGDQAMWRMRDLQERLDAGSDPEADRELTHLLMRAEFARPEMAAGFADELLASGFQIRPGRVREDRPTCPMFRCSGLRFAVSAAVTRRRMAGQFATPRRGRLGSRVTQPAVYDRPSNRSSTSRLMIAASAAAITAFQPPPGG